MNSIAPLRTFAGLALACSMLGVVGCTTPLKHDFDPFAHSACSDVPRELQKAVIPDYRVEPPDVLLIEIAHNVRSPSDPIKTGEDLTIRADLPAETSGAAPNPNAATAGLTGLTDYHLINGFYRVQADGSVDLGPIYGSVRIAGMSVDAARAAIAKHLRTVSGIAEVKASISYSDTSGRQVIAGEHLVRPDGQISLGVYGNVRVAGMTLEQVKQAVSAQLSNYLNDPDVRVDVLGYNSKVFYVVTDGGGNGERVDRLPFTGNETVLDAVASIQGLSDISSKRVWVARPSPPGCAGSQVMMVDWRGITQDGVTTTNYQILPGDRVYIKADDLIALDNALVKITTPVERVLGAILLGAGTYNRVLNAGVVTSSASSTPGTGF
ncbi:MAG TPA: polysaccharide biosynthesis/export family protein [Planctomycetaceae bacterium]|jgi:protein involved in polysaccharide export with SLBB domain|nr:polysaccharide biosynthesis/export family protein [Planctomycetaceae bacterium]